MIAKSIGTTLSTVQPVERLTWKAQVIGIKANFVARGRVGTKSVPTSVNSPVFICYSQINQQRLLKIGGC